MVHIKELPDGLELRSTSWYEIDAKRIELCWKDLRQNDKIGKYEFVEDHIEVQNSRIEIGSINEFVPQKIEYVIILKKRDSIDNLGEKEENSDIRNRVVDHEKGVGADPISIQE